MSRSRAVSKASVKDGTARTVPKKPATTRKTRNGSGSESARARRSLCVRLSTIAARLGTDEIAVLALVAQRLLLGRERYGALRLATDRRDFAREALEEAADGLAYAAAGLLRKKSRADQAARDKEEDNGG